MFGDYIYGADEIKSVKFLDHFSSVLGYNLWYKNAMNFIRLL